MSIRTKDQTFIAEYVDKKVTSKNILRNKHCYNCRHLKIVGVNKDSRFKTRCKVTDVKITELQFTCQLWKEAITRKSETKKEPKIA